MSKPDEEPDKEPHPTLVESCLEVENSPNLGEKKISTLNLPESRISTKTIGLSSRDHSATKSRLFSTRGSRILGSSKTPVRHNGNSDHELGGHKFVTLEGKLNELREKRIQESPIVVSVMKPENDDPAQEVFASYLPIKHQISSSPVSKRIPHNARKKSTKSIRKN